MPSPFASQEFINALVTFLVALSVALQAWAHGRTTKQGKQIDTIESQTNGIVGNLNSQIITAHTAATTAAATAAQIAALSEKDKQIAALSATLKERTSNGGKQ